MKPYDVEKMVAYSLPPDKKDEVTVFQVKRYEGNRPRLFPGGTWRRGIVRSFAPQAARVAFPGSPRMARQS
jgi:hypothetical protein